jgi:TonB family protein
MFKNTALVSRLPSFLILALLVLCALPIRSSAQTSSPDSSQRIRGIELFHQHNYSEAVRLLKQAIKKDKGDADAWFYLGLALLKDPKTLKDSSKAFETATKLRPSFAAAHAGFAYVLLIRNKNDDAAREAGAALTLDPTVADAYYVRGFTRLRAGAKKEALQDAESAIKLKPLLAPAYLLKSEALVSFFGDAMMATEDNSAESGKDRYSQAADALEKYLQLAPADPDRATWVQQLESLKYFVNTPKPGEPRLVYSGKEVTTKARVLSKPEPVYTEAARSKRVIGTVVLRCVFTAEGAVKHCLILKALPLGLTAQSLEAAKQVKFVPAMVDGLPVSMYIQMEYNFNLY